MCENLTSTRFSEKSVKQLFKKIPISGKEISVLVTEIAPNVDGVIDQNQQPDCLDKIQYF